MAGRGATCMEVLRSALGIAEERANVETQQEMLSLLYLNVFSGFHCP